VSLSLVVDRGVRMRADVRAKLRHACARMVMAAALHDARKSYVVVLRICDDVAIRELNRAWRGKDKPTDVLAFAQREAQTADASLLGDIVISLETAARQAKRGLAAELLHLASHGLCHLLGYDHQNDADEATMNARAAALRLEAARPGRVRAA
jgi:probable rRNA maturation factor